jgi:hypothetical protein
MNSFELEVAWPLLNSDCMGWICQHCGAPFVDSPYRVKSEESGIVLLDIIVCHYCFIEAQKLGLHTEQVGVHSLTDTGEMKTRA